MEILNAGSGFKKSCGEISPGFLYLSGSFAWCKDVRCLMDKVNHYAVQFLNRGGEIWAVSKSVLRFPESHTGILESLFC